VLTPDQLRALMADIESDRVEKTTSTRNTDKLGEAVCAFANDFPGHRQPGYLLVGVDDDGHAGGLIVTDELLRALGDLRSNVNLEPLPAMTIQKYTVEGGDVAVVEVMPSDLPPVRYKGRVWIRVGPSRRGANQQEERILTERRTALQRTFDARPCHGSTSKDLIPDLFLVTYLPAAVAHAYPVAESVLRERTETDYPPVAIRELLLNAIMHRSYESNAPVRFYWYDDRIEIQNPGGLYGMASPENFPGQTDYRNPVVAGAMATLGYVNAFGRGVIRAQEALRRNGNPAAEFALEPSHVLATIRRKP